MVAKYYCNCTTKFAKTIRCEAVLCILRFFPMSLTSSIILKYESHRIGGNHERRVLNNFMLLITKVNIFDCQNRYNGNRKCLI